MKLSAAQQIDAAPETVWDALMNPEILMAAIPGCKEMTGNPEDGFEAVVVQKVGPVKATFKGQITLSDMDPPNRVSITGEGKGGPAGFAKGGADVTLTAKDGGTELGYDVEAKVGGKLAQLGGRIIDGFAKKMADQFFTRFQEILEAPAQDDPDQAGGEPPDQGGDGGDDGAPAKKKGWLKGLISH